MRQEQRLQFSRCHLETLDFDELLDAVNDGHVPISVNGTNVTRVEPAISVHRECRCLRIVQIPLHHHRSPHPQLPLTIDGLICSRHGVDDAALGVRHGDTTRPGLELSGRREM